MASGDNKLVMLVSGLRLWKIDPQLDDFSLIVIASDSNDISF